jgi:DHA1 family solute carrier family 18 vesicular amine transporter 1/2
MNRPAFCTYSLLVVNSAVLTAFFPLVPTFTQEFSLSKVQMGAVLASMGVAILIVAVPAGVLTDLLGARVLTIGAATLVSLSALGHALAVGFWSLLAARTLFGLAAATTFTAGLTFLAESVPAERRSTALGAIAPISGLGGLVGFALGGVLAHDFSVSTPFLALSAVALVLAVALTLSKADLPTLYRPPLPLFQTLQATRSEPLVLAAVLLIFLGGISESVVNFLAPLQLHLNGMSADKIGIALAVSSAFFVLVSACVARAVEHAVRFRVGGVAILLLGGSLTLLVASASTVAVMAGVILRMALLGVLYTIAFPLGALGAFRSGLGRGAVNGLLLLTLGAANLTGPFAGGVLAQAVGDRWTYAALIGCCVAVAVWMLTRGEARVTSRSVV